MLKASPQLKQLADALRPALGLIPVEHAPEPDMELARFAVVRHRVGPLLYRAWFVADGGQPAHGEVREFLAAQASRNGRRELRQKAAARKFGALLAGAGIATLTVKGWRLGEELYGESALRLAKDVDILVAPQQFDHALQIAAGAGYVLAKREGQGGLSRARRIMRYHREVSVVDPDLGIELELHQRLLSYPPPGWVDVAITEAAATIRNPDYVLYLFAHGAMTGWQRLKWLCDLAMLLRRVTPDTRRATIARAREMRCEEALLASTLAVGELWGPDPAEPWVAESACAPHDRLVQQHLAGFARRMNQQGNAPLAERVLRHARLIKDAPVFGEHPPTLSTVRDSAMLWLLWKL